MRSSRDSRTFDHALITAAFLRHKDTLHATFEDEAVRTKIARGAELILETFESGKKVLICGNGGSSADASHLAGELVVKYKEARRALPAIALTETAALTAAGNDLGYQDVFARQVEAFGTPGDLLILISTSGTSPNIQRALETAHTRGLSTLALTGAGGREHLGAADLVIAIPSYETARIQEMHGIVYHAWCEYIDTQYV